MTTSYDIQVMPMYRLGDYENVPSRFYLVGKRVHNISRFTVRRFGGEYIASTVSTDEDDVPIIVPSFNWSVVYALCTALVEDGFHVDVFTALYDR